MMPEPDEKGVAETTPRMLFTAQPCHAPGENSSARTAPHPDQLRQLAIACLLEGGRRAFKLVGMEAGKEKYRYFKEVWDLIVIGHLGFASPAAKFTSTSELARMAGVSRGTTGRAIDAVIRWNMVHDMGGGRRPLLLCVNPNIETWQIAKTISDDAWLIMLREWRIFCCTTQSELPLPDYGPADPTLQQLLALVNVEMAADNTRSTVEQERVNRSIVEHEDCSTVEHKRGSTVEQSPQHTNVGVRVRSLLRHTSDAIEVNRVLKIALDYMAKDRRVNMDKERRNPIWPVLAALPDWPNPLEQAVKDCKDSSTVTTKNNAARLMDSVKAMIGPERYFQRFPNSKSEWTR